MRALPREERLAAAKQILGEDVVTLKQVKHLLRVRVIFAARHSHARCVMRRVVCTIVCERVRVCACVHACLRASRRLQDWALQPADRVELLVLTFARIVEHRGFFQLCDLLTKEEFALLQRRLGYHNIYDPFSSVHYFELNLQLAEHREITAHIVRLAVLEPGDNVMDAWFCGLRFEIPAGWCSRLPKDGVLTLFYCREQRTIDQLVEGEHPDCVPSNFKSFQPADTEWCIEEKKFQIKAKLQAVFPSAEACFQVLARAAAPCNSPPSPPHTRTSFAGARYGRGGVTRPQRDQPRAARQRHMAVS